MSKVAVAGSNLTQCEWRKQILLISKPEGEVFNESGALRLLLTGDPGGTAKVFKNILQTKM